MWERIKAACRKEGAANPFTWAWAIWFFLLIVFEALALVIQVKNDGRQRTTLSQHWSAFAKKAPKLWFPVMGGFLGWLIWHWVIEPYMKVKGAG